MRTVRLVAAAAAGMLLALSLPAPASAGGPTSALLVAPDSNAVGLYHSDPEYEKLSDLVDSPRASPEDPAAGSHGEGPFVTVTWMIHDVRVWRVDRIYYEADGGPWIHTVTNLEGSELTWHRSSQPDELVGLLEKLDLTNGEYAGPLVTPEFADERAPAQPAGSGSDGEEFGASPTTPQDPRPANDSVSGWWWAGGGALAGMLLAGVAVRLYPSVRLPRPERQQLVDY